MTFRVVCITQEIDRIKTGPVLISVKNKFSDASNVMFSYVVSLPLCFIHSNYNALRSNFFCLDMKATNAK